MQAPSASDCEGRLSVRFWRRQPVKAVRLSWQAWRHGTSAWERSPEHLAGEIRDILRRYDEANAGQVDRHRFGGARQSERVAALADWAASVAPGDLIEIGAAKGETTRLLAPVAQRYRRRLIVVDPWIAGTQDCKGGEYEEFQRNTAPWRSLIEECRFPSHHPEAFARLRGRALCFAFVDGLHTFDACWNDFLLVRETRGLVVADDARYNPEVALAARIRAMQFGWRTVQLPQIREALLAPAGRAVAS